VVRVLHVERTARPYSHTTSQPSTLELLAAAGRRQGWNDGRIQRVQQLLQLRAGAPAPVKGVANLALHQRAFSADACTAVQVRWLTRHDQPLEDLMRWVRSFFVGPCSEMYCNYVFLLAGTSGNNPHQRGSISARRDECRSCCCLRWQVRWHRTRRRAQCREKAGPQVAHSQWCTMPRGAKIRAGGSHRHGPDCIQRVLAWRAV
jgi:hypothetical protein